MVAGDGADASALPAGCVDLLRDATPELADVDEPILEYLAASILELSAAEAAGTGDEDAAALAESTCGIELGERARTGVNAAAAYLVDICRGQACICSASIPPAAAPAPEPAAQELALLQLEEAVASVLPRPRVAAPRLGAAADAAPAEEEDGEAVAFLNAMAPDVPPAVVAHVLRDRCRGDRAEAAEALADLCTREDSAAEVRRLAVFVRRREEDAAEAAEATARRDREQKRSLLGRYDEVKDGVALAPPRLPYMPVAGNRSAVRGKGNPVAVRYRDGEVVRVSKGQKFIVE